MMLDAVVGAVIMVIAATSLLSAVEVIEKAFADAGRQELSRREHSLICRLQKQDVSAGNGDCENDGLKSERSQFWQDSVLTLPRQVIQMDAE